MKYIVKSRDVLRAFAEANYLKELAQKALDNPAEGKFLVDSEREKKILEGNYVGGGPEQDMALRPTMIKPNGDWGNCR